MSIEEETKVWGVFVGKAGNQLANYNMMAGPFPPEPGTDGYIAIGWPAVGDMRLYTDNYADYVNKFRIVYPKDGERTFKITANMLWNFAFKMKEGDWVISPSATSKFLLAGKIQGGHITNFRNNDLFPKGRRDFVNLRKVKWLYVIAQKDPRYAKIHRIGLQTVVQPNISSSDLKAILNG